MTTPIRFSLISTILILTLIAQSHPLTGDGAIMSCSLATDKPIVHSPVFVKVTIQNGSGVPFIFDKGASAYGYRSFTAKLTTPDGRLILPANPTHKLTTGERVLIAPYTSSDTLLLVNKWFDFDMAGRYLLDLEMTKPPLSPAGFSAGDVNLRRVVIDIGPRDAVSLERICGELESTVKNSSTTAQALEAAETLSHVKDPIAVFYISRLLGIDRGPAPLLIRGLDAIGSAAAVDALIDHRNDPSEDIRDLVRSALLRIAERTSDNAIRQRIKSSIQ